MSNASLLSTTSYNKEAPEIILHLILCYPFQFKASKERGKKQKKPNGTSNIKAYQLTDFILPVVRMLH